MSVQEGKFQPPKPVVDHEAVYRITYYWAARFADVVGEYPEATGGEFGFFADAALERGFSEVRRTINYYLLVAKDPSFVDFVDRWKDFLVTAQNTKHDRMIRHPDLRLENGESEG